jgi:hypothetical protein
MYLNRNRTSLPTGRRHGYQSTVTSSYFSLLTICKFSLFNLALMGFGGKPWTLQALFLAKTKKYTCFNPHGLKHRGNSKIRQGKCPLSHFSMLGAQRSPSQRPVLMLMSRTSSFLLRTSIIVLRPLAS